MGNGNFLTEKLTCQDVSRDEYYNNRSKAWNFQENYLYQTEIEQVDGDHLKVFTYDISTTDREYESYFQKLNMMSKYLNKGNIQLPLLCISENKDQCNCSPHNKQSVKVQMNKIVLQQEVRVRAQYRQSFNEKQIWYILYNVINGLRQFQPFFEPSGNLTPKEILMNQRGEIKLKTSLSSPFQHSRKSIYVNCFAPQELSLMRKVFGQQGVLTRNLYKDYQLNPNICQVYSLGVVIISVLTGRPHLYYYDPPFEPHHSHINHGLQQIQQMGYSRTLMNLLKIMVTSYENRPLPSQIYQVFHPFRQQILNFQPFSLSLASSEVHSVK